MRRLSTHRSLNGTIGGFGYLNLPLVAKADTPRRNGRVLLGTIPLFPRVLIPCSTTVPALRSQRFPHIRHCCRNRRLAPDVLVCTSDKTVWPLVRTSKSLKHASGHSRIAVSSLRILEQPGTRAVLAPLLPGQAARPFVPASLQLALHTQRFWNMRTEVRLLQKALLDASCDCSV
jgi:hypothetical protein